MLDVGPKMANKAVVKHMKMFRKIPNICLHNGWIQIDPSANFKGKYKKVDKLYWLSKRLS